MANEYICIRFTLALPFITLIMVHIRKYLSALALESNDKCQALSTSSIVASCDTGMAKEVEMIVISTYVYCLP